MAGVFGLMTLLSLTAGIISGVVPCRKTRKKKREPPQIQGISQVFSGTPDMDRAVEEGCTKDYTYEYVNDESSTDVDRTAEEGCTKDYTYKYVNDENATDVDRTAEEGCTKDYTYKYVNDESSTDVRGLLYQGLDVGMQDYVSVYNQLRGETYEELDPQGREWEHHYQRANHSREGRGRRK